MNGMHNGWDAGWWVLMSVLAVALVALVVWAIMRLLPARPSAASEDDAQATLDRRLASGEIDTSTYDELRKRIDRGALAGGR